MEMFEYESTDSFTYFYKKKEVNIDEVNEGDLIFLEVKSPLNYGLKTSKFYGEITKKTRCYFFMLEYCDGIINNCKTNQITRRKSNAKPPIRKWAKKSIINIFLVDAVEKIETHQYHTNSKEYYEKICKID